MPTPDSESRPHEVEPTAPDVTDRGWWLAAVVAVWAAWFPVETSPLSGPLVAVCLVVLAVWRWETGAAAAGRRAVAVLLLVAMVLAVSGVAGRDPARAISQLALLGAVLSAVWVARQTRPPEWAPAALTVAIAALAVWAGWQEIAGFDALRSGLDGFTGAEREYVATRIASGRPFASQLVPGHLAVLLATAIPVLLGRLRHGAWRLPWVVAAAVAAGGLLLTRSPLGLALAAVAVAVTAIGTRSRTVAVLASAMAAVALVVVVWMRPDVARLEPVSLRLDNWGTALAVWQEAPAAGVGFGGFGQAAQTVALEPGNRPAHAHTVIGESLAELGPAGVAASLGVLAVVGSIAWRVRRKDPWLAAAVLVVPLHNLLDFSWWVSGVALPWAVLFGWAAARAAPGPTSAGRSPARDPFRTVVIVGGTAVIALTLMHATSRWSEWSVARSDPPSQRVAAFERAWRLAPWRPDPALRSATAALEWNDRAALERAARRLDRVAWLRPFSADVAAVRAHVRQALGDEAAAAASAWNVDRRRAAAAGGPDGDRRVGDAGAAGR